MPDDPQRKLISTRKGLSSVFETGTIYGQCVKTTVLGTKCYGFRLWVGCMDRTVSMLRQVDAWYLPVGTSKDLLARCEELLVEGTVVAITGERRTYAKYDGKNHMLTSIQVNIGKRICVLGVSDRASDVAARIARLKPTDVLFEDTGEDVSDELGEEEAVAD